jgi:hypothetical protein
MKNPLKTKRNSKGETSPAYFLNSIGEIKYEEQQGKFVNLLRTLQPVGKVGTEEKKMFVNG